ncbi:hypothetical protein ABEB36_008848 [Hypothenemus hampei]|uniref:Uncharacterized protein n=1 Tax=Hypothenemus hampei TaxID=57062 RepID=A0ABD1EN94_HYPHA
MLKGIGIFVGLISIIQLLGTTNSLQCYDCTGPRGQNHDCEVNLSNVNSVICTPGFQCVLYISTVGNTSTIHRLCAQSNECEVIQAENTHVISNNRTLEVCTTCNQTDNCNLAYSNFVNSSMLSLVLFSLLTITFNMFHGKLY